MSDQSEMAANQPSQPQPCKMGCGFFGSNATGDCCSKCWRENQNTNNKQAAVVENPVAVSVPLDVANVNQPTTLDDISQVKEDGCKEAELKSLSDVATPKKKKKKTSYKAMLEGMMTGSGTSTDIEKQKDKIRSVTGGGVFVKIDKI